MVFVLDVVGEANLNLMLNFNMIMNVKVHAVLNGETSRTWDSIFEFHV